MILISVVFGGSGGTTKYQRGIPILQLTLDHRNKEDREGKRLSGGIRRDGQEALTTWVGQRCGICTYLNYRANSTVNIRYKLQKPNFKMCQARRQTWKWKETWGYWWERS